MKYLTGSLDLEIKDSLCLARPVKEIYSGHSQKNSGQIDVTLKNNSKTLIDTLVIISRPGRSQGLLYKHLRHSLIHWFIHSVSEPFPSRALRCRHDQTVRDSSSSYKIDYVIVIKTFLNPEGHPNRISGSKVTAISLKGLILSIGGASAVEGLRSTGLPGLVFNLFWT